MLIPFLYEVVDSSSKLAGSKQSEGEYERIFLMFQNPKVRV